MKRASPSRRRRIVLAMELPVSLGRRVGIADYARKAGWILDSRLFAFLVHGLHKEYLASTQIDGIISMTYSTLPEMQKVVSAAKVPVVDLWHDYPDWKVPRVLLDHSRIGRIGAAHLLDSGLRNLLFYTHSVDRRAADIRRSGFRDCALERGVKIADLSWDTRTRMPRGVGRIGWLATQLKRLGTPLGVMAVNDVVATEVLDAAEQAGLRVPEDVAVLGADNDPILTELGSIPMSSVDFGLARVGYRAAELLDGIMDGKKPPLGATLIVPAGVVTRRSTEVIAVTDPDIRKAARFIRDHFAEPITVADVAHKSFLSRRRLQDRFRLAIGRGMSEEITRQRLAFARHLLTQTRHKLSTVATMSGFRTMQRMSKVFRRELNTTPHAYRQEHTLKLVGN